MKSNILFLVICLSLNIVGCKKQDAATTAATGTGTDAGLSASTIAGSATSPCQSGSGLINGHGYTYTYFLQANGNYNFSMTVVDSATCAMGSPELIKYTQFGTYSIVGAATTPSGAYKVKFSVGSASFSVPDNTYAYKVYFNSTVNCGTPSLNVVGSSSSTVSTSGRTCGPYFPFPTYTTDYYNVIVYTASPQSFQVYSDTSLWYAGSVSYPASVNMTYTY